MSLTLLKVDVWGAVDMHFLALTLVLKLDLDMVLIYHCAKKVSIPSPPKVTARTDNRYTDGTKTLPLRLCGW